MGMEGYVNDLRSLITNLGLADKVELVLAAPPQKVVDILKSGLVQVRDVWTFVQSLPKSAYNRHTVTVKAPCPCSAVVPMVAPYRYCFASMLSVPCSGI